MLSFFFGKLQFITIFLSYMSLYELKHKVRLSKTGLEIFHFPVRFILIKVLFLFNKMHGLFNFKSSFKIKIIKKFTHSFTPRPLIFKFQQEVKKFSNICLSWSCQKTDLVTSFLKLENRNFENISFSQ